MRLCFRKFFLASLTLMAGGAPAQEATMALDQAREGDEFDFYWASGSIDAEGLEYGVGQAQKYYAGVSALLGYEPDTKLLILLLGPAEVDGKRRGSPGVDGEGRIRLFRYGPTYHGYFGALPHEMVHAFRIDRLPHYDWFFEEGFAEFVALRVGKSMQGFPWYDTPVTIAAGQWLVKGEDIPLQVLRDEHEDVNMACRAQSYTLRSSFFDWLGRRYGDDTVLAMAAREQAGALEDYESLTGKSFDALAAEWRDALVTDYRGTQDADVLAENYRTRTPIQYMPVCRDGA